MIPIIMPRQGQSVESCIITKWHKQPGDPVAPGELLFSYETDKSAFDEEAQEAGVLLAILHQEGDDVPVLEPVCILGSADEDPSAYQASTGQAEAPVQSPASPQASPAEASSVAPGAPQIPQAFAASGISPRARALAARGSADLSQATPTGPNGRIIARDVQSLLDAGKTATRAAQGVVTAGIQGTGIGGRASLRDVAASAPGAAGTSASTPPPTKASGDAAQTPGMQGMPETQIPPASQWRDEPLSNIRKRIATAMHDSLAAMAQLTHTVTYDATAVLALRKRCKESGAAYGMQGVTIGDIIAYAVIRTLLQPEHAHLNAHLLGDTMRYFSPVHLGIAVDTPRGLMVPTLRNADRMTLAQISSEIKSLAETCQRGAIDPDLLAGATFTLSNLGAYEIEHFTPVINPPQTGILGVNTIQQRVRERDGAIEVYPAMSLSLTYDHRALDGAPASRFLRDLKRNLENIDLLLAGGAYNG